MRLGARFVSFAMVGIGGFVVDVACLMLLLDVTTLGPYSARIFSFLLAVTTTWAFNRRITFADAQRGSKANEWARFLTVNGLGGTVNYAVYAGLVGNVPAVAAAPWLGVAAGSLAGLAFNFTGSHLLVFRTTRKAGPARATSNPSRSSFRLPRR